MKKSRFIYLLLIVIVIFCTFGCKDSEINQDPMGTEYSLVYFDYVEGFYFEKNISISNGNIEEEIIQELLSKNNLPEDMYSQIGFSKLVLESISYDSESKEIDLYFNKYLYDLKNNSNVLKSLISCISMTLEKLDTVEIINYHVDGEFVEGIGEIQVSGELIKSSDE